MLNNHKKAFFSICSILLFICVWCLPIASLSAQAATYETKINETTGYQYFVVDQAGLFTQEEVRSLYSLLADTAAYGNAAVVTITQNSYSSTKEYAEHLFMTTWGDTSGVIFVIDMEQRYLYLCTDGDIYVRVDTGKANSITDNVYTYATKGQWGACAIETMQEVNTVLDGGRIAEPMKWISTLLLALMLAMIINYIRALLEASFVKASSRDIAEKMICQTTISDPRIIRTGITRIPIPKSSSSSSGGGGGGGGGFSGGGGGHSF